MSCTCRTPSVFFAIETASWRAASVSTRPRSVTTPSSAETLMNRAFTSSSAKYCA
jgi:hypothetical protein